MARHTPRSLATSLGLFLLLSGFHHHHHSGSSHSGGSSLSTGCGGSPGKPERSEPKVRWELGGELTVAQVAQPAVARITVTQVPGGAVHGALVSINGVSLTEAEEGVYLGELRAPEAGSVVRIQALGEHPTEVLELMPAAATDLVLKGDSLRFVEHGHAEEVTVTEQGPDQASEQVSVEFEEDAPAVATLPPLPGRTAVIVAVTMHPESFLGPSGVALIDSTARLSLPAER